MLGITIHIFNGMNEWIGDHIWTTISCMIILPTTFKMDYTMKGKKRQTNNEIRLGEGLGARGEGGGIIISTLQHLITLLQF